MQASPFSPATHAPVAGSHFCGQLPTVSPPQFFGTPMQAPAPSQVLVVHRLPSSHGVPLAFGVAWVQVPVAGSQVGWFQQPAGSATGWQIIEVPLHTPSSQWSPVVQALPSSHGVPNSAGGLLHWPVAGSQIPAARHWSTGGQVIAVPAHMPFG
jgi:hypothetical protein